MADPDDNVIIVADVSEYIQSMQRAKKAWTSPESWD